MKRKKKSTVGIIEKCAGELMRRMSMIEIHSDYELVLSGCIGIADYNSEEVVMDTVSGKVCVKGIFLSINIFRGDLICINGRIRSVNFGDSEC